MLSNTEDQQNVLCDYCVKEVSASLFRPFWKAIFTLNGISKGTGRC